MVVGILNTFAALARATTLFFSVWRSMDCTPNAICGWWSIKMTCEFCGVRTSSLGFAMGDLQRRCCRNQFAERWLDGALPRCANTSPRATPNPGATQFDDLV